MEKNLKIYIDTTIPNYAFNDHIPDKQKAAKALFEQNKEGKIDIFVSEVVIDELANAPLAKQKKMAELIKNIPALEVTDECKELAEEYIKRGIIPRENREDALHIAITSFYGLDALVSYNFEHIVRLKTIREVTATNMILGYRTINLIIPEEVADV